MTRCTQSQKVSRKRAALDKAAFLLFNGHDEPADRRNEVKVAGGY